MDLRLAIEFPCYYVMTRVNQLNRKSTEKINLLLWAKDFEPPDVRVLAIHVIGDDGNLNNVCMNWFTMCMRASKTDHLAHFLNPKMEKLTIHHRLPLVH